MPNVAKPSRVKELAGNPGKRKVNRKEPKPTGVPTPPKIISEAALVVWKRLVSSMPKGVYTDADTGLLVAYCEAVANHEEATAALTREPKMVNGSTGQPVLNPWFRHQSDQARLIVTLGARLGLDPVSRQAINAVEDSAEDNPFGIH